MEKYIKDPIHGNIKVDPKLIDNPYFQRLRHVVQNGMAYMVFPSMRHTRFEHSLGTYHVASKMVDRVVKKSLEEKFSDDFKEKIRKLALYHDIGHFPFSHTFEFALEVLKYLNRDKYNEVINLTGFSKDLFKLHEMMGIRLLEEMGEKEIATLMREVYKDKSSDELVNIARLIINSDLDADRLDYLQRDSYYSGAKFGIIDPERIIITMRITPEGYVFPPKAIDDLEHFFLARFHMYSSVYNHSVIEIYNRVMAYFIAFAINESILKLPSDLEEFKTFTDEQIFLALVEAKNKPEFSHFYSSLVERRKYKRALLQGSQAHDLLKIITKNEKEFYQTILRYKGKIVIGDAELRTSTNNIKIERKMGQRTYLKDFKEEDAVTIPPERHRIYIGAYDDDSAKQIMEYFEKEFSINISSEFKP
ncbi:HD domain-containing protein [Saccharolobus shibatae]|uniref:DNTP triphosphohydrolase, broad substrate specificity n=1 Tax=Saccharolobus shibatae TaxID=2286 RepID=A0A8F5C103_9CREN|nr:HD domain-containing protein [Saccharolobus shibatae]QXJ35005.1 dNTP triphosphohydrolase, broad substrate specificity [Saccharolobus shibatae]